MSKYSLTHLSDSLLLRSLAAVLARERTDAAEVLAHIAEVDARKLYVPAGFPSMYLYCVHELRLCEQAAYKRILAARAARRFPTIFEAVADGRLHLSAVVLLAPHLIQQNADELLATATHKTKSEIEQLLAQRFPRPDVPTLVQPLSAPASTAVQMDQLSPGIVEELAPRSVEALGQLAPAQAEGPRPRVTPLAPERFAIQFTIGKETHEMLDYAEQLLSHTIPSGDTAQVFHRLLELAIPQLEKQKFARTPKPRRSRTSSANPRYIPAHVKRAVWERDDGRCTFMSEGGKRCPSRKFLEYDHVDPVARGGQATVACVRLRCRVHNQFEAERTFGAGFMKNKREGARRAAEARAEAKARAEAEAQTQRVAAAERAKERDVVPWLRALGFRVDEARKAAALCENIPDASLEQRVRVALTYFGPRHAPAH